MVTSATIMQAETSFAQIAAVEGWTEQCRQLLKKDISELTDEELFALKLCLEPLKQREEEKKMPAAQVPAIQRSAPLRIYGK